MNPKFMIAFSKFIEALNNKYPDLELNAEYADDYYKDAVIVYHNSDKLNNDEIFEKFNCEILNRLFFDNNMYCICFCYTPSSFHEAQPIQEFIKVLEYDIYGDWCEIY